MDRSTPEILTSSRGQDSLATAVSMVDAAATIILRSRHQTHPTVATDD